MKKLNLLESALIFGLSLLACSQKLETDMIIDEYQELGCNTVIEVTDEFLSKINSMSVYLDINVNMEDFDYTDRQITIIKGLAKASLSSIRGL